MGKKGNIIFVGGMTAIGLTVWIAYTIILKPDTISEVSAPKLLPPALQPPTPAQQKQRALFVHKTQGSVQLRKPEGEWTRIKEGEEISDGDRLRSDANGRASVQYGESVALEISSDTTLTVREKDDHRLRVLVERGLVIADVLRGQGERVRLSGNDELTYAETQGGRMHVISDPNGQLQAAVTRGEAQVHSQGKIIVLKKGFQTTVVPGKPLKGPRPIPKSLLLKIKWPPEGSTTARKQIIEGQTSPGARVRLGEHIVTADENGKFSQSVVLKEGVNNFAARVIDIVGREHTQASPPVELDTRPPDHEIEVPKNLWGDE